MTSAKEVYSQLYGIRQDYGCISQYAVVYAVFSGSGKKGQDNTSLPWCYRGVNTHHDRWGGLRKEAANVWNVGLGRTEETPSTCLSWFVSLPRSGALEFWGWRMRIYYLTFNPFSNPHKSY